MTERERRDAPDEREPGRQTSAEQRELPEPAAAGDLPQRGTVLRRERRHDPASTDHGGRCLLVQLLLLERCERTVAADDGC